MTELLWLAATNQFFRPTLVFGCGVFFWTWRPLGRPYSEGLGGYPFFWVLRLAVSPLRRVPFGKRRNAGPAQRNQKVFALTQPADGLQDQKLLELALIVCRSCRRLRSFAFAFLWERACSRRRYVPRSRTALQNRFTPSHTQPALFPQTYQPDSPPPFPPSACGSARWRWPDAVAAPLVH